MGSRVFNQDILEKKTIYKLVFLGPDTYYKSYKNVESQKKYALLYIFERVPNWHTGMLTQFD